MRWPVHRRTRRGEWAWASPPRFPQGAWMPSEHSVFVLLISVNSSRRGRCKADLYVLVEDAAALACMYDSSDRSFYSFWKFTCKYS